MIILFRWQKGSLNLLILIIFATWAVRPTLYSQDSWVLNSSTLTYLDYFILGIILAMYKDYFARVRMSFWLGLVVCLGAVVLPFTGPEVFTIRGLGAFVIVASALSNQPLKLLESRFLSAIGIRSYGIFLCHIAVFWYVSVPILDCFAITGFGIRFILGGLVAFTISYFLSDGSLRLIENPMKRAPIRNVALTSLAALGIIVFLSTLSK